MSPRAPRFFLLALLTLLLACANANAGLFRAYLSVAGNDANPCTLPLPCRLLPAALAAIDDGGEIWMLDSANFNSMPPIVAKSVTILAVPGALGSLVANGGAAIEVNAPGAKVVLRNLVLGKIGTGSNGLRFVQGASVTVEDCEIFGQVGGAGISAFAPNSRLVVRGTVIRNNGFGILIDGTVDTTLDRVHIIGNTNLGMQVSDGSTTTVSNSRVIGNGDAGISARALSGGTTKLSVERTVIGQGLNNGLYVAAIGATSIAQVTVSRSVISGNNNLGLVSNASGGASATLVLDENTIASQPTGVSMFGTGVGLTRQNNTFQFNGMDVGSGALAPLAAK